MTLRVDVQHRLGAFSLDAAFASGGRLTALYGASGSGKTTLVNLIGGLLRPAHGRIEIDGRVLVDTEGGIFVPMHRRRIGYVFQDARLFPHLTVSQNLRYGRWFTPKAKRYSDHDSVVELLGIGHLLERRPGMLSGGEKQRVAIGRALIASPALILMDEPLAALDDARKDEILPYIERLRDEIRIPIVYVSHVIAEVARLATDIVVLRDGRILSAGPADALLSDPETVSMIGRREAGSILTARILCHHDDGLTEMEMANERLFLPGVEGASGDTVRLRVPAQDIILSRTRPEGLSALNILPATVVSVTTSDGPGALVLIQVGGDRVLARITRRSAVALELAPGVAVFAIMKSIAVSRRDIGHDRDADAPVEAWPQRPA